MKKIFKNTLIIWGLLGLGYISVTADYSSLTKNTGDTLTAANWNQLVENVKWIQTDSNWMVSIFTNSDISSFKVWWDSSVRTIQQIYNYSWWDAKLLLSTQASGGDPYTTYNMVGETNWHVWWDRSDGWKFKIWNSQQNSHDVSSGNRLTIDTTWKVWIWTTTPNWMLNIASIVDVQASTNAHGLTIGQSTWLNLAIDNNEILARNNGGFSNLYLQASSSTAHTIINRVGWSTLIWTDGPAVGKLDIKAGNWGIPLYAETTGNVLWRFYRDSDVSTSSKWQNIQFQFNNAWTKETRVSLNPSWVSNWGGAFQIHTANTSWTLESRMYIDEEWRVWIWEQIPKSQLHVNWIIEYTDNTAAIAWWLTPWAVYRTGDVLKIAH